jgi:hypothetical protein
MTLLLKRIHPFIHLILFKEADNVAYTADSKLSKFVREELIPTLPRTITSIRVITQAEYDALPATKTSDNTLYLIEE